MRARYGVAAAFAAAIALVLVLRNEGYLHGRVEGGPLTLASSDQFLAAEPRRTAGIGLELDLEGDAVEIERVRPEFVSPGLRLLGPRRTETRCDRCAIARWPPAGTTPLRRATVADARSEALLGLRAERPGIYYVHDLTTLYTRGLKGFRQRLRVDYCVVVRRRGARPAECAPGYRPPRGEATVTEAGGASRYGVPIEDGVARYRARSDTRELTLTLTNLADTRRRVSAVAADLELDGAEIAVRAVSEDAVVIGPRAGRRLRLEVSVDGCATSGGTIDALQARVGDRMQPVPLSVPLEFAAPRRCG